MNPNLEVQIAPKANSTASLLLERERKEKRPKACANCRRAKVKCIKDDNEGNCKRCQAQGIQCVYEYKVTGYKAANGKETPEVQPPPKQLPVISSSLTKYLKPNGNGNEWKSSVEDRLSNFDSKLGSILSLLERQSSPSPSSSSPIPEFNKRSIEYPIENAKRQKLSQEIEVIELRIEDILSLEEAKSLFEFFDKNISPQLFGFDISNYSVDGIWNTCPLLIASICCIASIHHPDYNRLSKPLEALIYRISKEILFYTPKTEVEAFNTIVGLCFCGFWFKKSQMFTGLALQLARTMNLVSPNKKNSVISKQDRLKLWYLLYILDGQQSLAFNRHPLVNREEKMFAKSKEILLSNEEEENEGKIIDLEKEQEVSNEDEEVEDSKVKYSSNYSNLRLVSQVEYHHALSNVLEGDAWELLMPSSFGLPFKTNLELDKWMVQWTVLLSPFNNHPVWSSKSTLIYYNFAKMHINSCAVRKFQMDFNGGVELPKFDEMVDFNIEEETNDEEEEVFNEEDSSEDEDESDLDLSKELSPYQSGKVSSELALSAAETVLNIVLNDLDVRNVIKYVPIHIHVMLYYAALLVLKPMKYLINEKNLSSFDNSLKSIQLVRRLVDAIESNSPTDKDFSCKITEGLNGLINDKVSSIQDVIKDDEEKMKALELSLKVEDSSSRRRPPKISAWPGYDAGHPSKAQ